ncbi:hypothetical protein [Desulfuribacillus alkaliarsenatis]|uniref:EF-hand domain-containing protein n=1 Tax=Desulfuribacillus alkaliarsenatis TaxID=766136 RepID=A0A1E5G5P4_9FIRM|nr:hypothetical protein [Desulfuribacillus alkaliarsenatis]OEF98506.1 hypothetical protein BHF68_02195 [Desulfuribacillus alkaliarsenatis]
MKRMTAIAIALLLVLLSLWTGLYKAVEDQEGFYYINPNFAMMNKSLFLQENEYSSKRNLNQTIKLCRENAIRKVYLELSPATKQQRIKQAEGLFKTYGIQVGYWYNVQSPGSLGLLDTLEQIEEIYNEFQKSNIDLYFIIRTSAEEFLSYQQSYLNLIVEATNYIDNKRKDTNINIDVGWIIPAISESDNYRVTYNNYSKRATYHIMDLADVLAIIPKTHTSLKSQVLNETMYANRIDKKVNVAISEQSGDGYVNNKQYFVQLVNKEYQELIQIAPNIELIFLDQNMLLDKISYRYDLNGDGKVNLQDIGIFISDYIRGDTTEKHDFNRSQVVDIYDLISIFLNLRGR